MLNIIKSAFDLRNESDYDDFHVTSKEDIAKQVAEATFFLDEVAKYLTEKTK